MASRVVRRAVMTTLLSAAALIVLRAQSPATVTITLVRWPLT